MVSQQQRTEVEPVIELLEASAQIAQLEAEITQLKDALAKRQQIGVATGLLAQRFDIAPERAWSLLVRLSQNGHVKVRDIAQAMINAHTGRLSAAEAEILSAIQSHLPGDVRLVSSTVNRQQANGDGNCSAASVRHVPLG
jgi:outer membrane protein TolC